MAIIHHFLVFNGKSSLDFGVKISGGGTFSAPQRVYESVDISGRNGALLIDQNRYENYQLTYPAFIAKFFPERVEAFRNFMLSSTGYCRLEDTYHLDEYRMACFSGGLDVSTTPGNKGGRFDVVFNAKPQRWLKDGEVQLTITSGQLLRNPTLFDAKPLIRVYGAGTLTVGSESVVVASHSDSYLDIDCELMDCYCGSTNKNSYVTFANDSYPVLTGGAQTGIAFTSGITKVLVTPRWWRL